MLLPEIEKSLVGSGRPKSQISPTVPVHIAMNAFSHAIEKRNKFNIIESSNFTRELNEIASSSPHMYYAHSHTHAITPTTGTSNLL
jgi:hypothetical protein